MKFLAQAFLCLGLIGTAYLDSGALQVRQVPNDGTVKLWDPIKGVARDISFEEGDVTALAISPDSTILAAGSANRMIDLWDLNTGKKIGGFTGHREAVQSLAFSPDGRTLASGSWDGTIKLWSVATGKQLASLVGNSGEVLSVAFCPTGTYLASGGGDEKIRVWNVATKRIARTFVGHKGKINSVAFSFDCEVLATGSDDKTVKLWDVETGGLLHTLDGHSGPVQSVAFNPRDKTLASASRDKTIKIWDIVSGSEVLTLRGHISSVDYVAFSAKGETLASGSYDKTIKLWDSATGRELHTLEGHTQRVTALAFSPDGKILASGSALTRLESPTLHVLSVGITNYYNSTFAIDLAAKDARDFAAALEKAGRTRFERVNVRVLTDFGASQPAVSSAVYRIIDEAKPQDVFVFFFAGQATIDFDYNTREEQFGLYASDAGKLTDVLLRSWLTKIEARHQLIILETKDPTKGYESFIKQFATENKALRGLLKRDLIILANESKETSIPKLKNRFLTYRLLEGLAGGAALEGGELTANSLVSYAKDTQSVLPKEVTRRTGAIMSFSIGEDFPLGHFSKTGGRFPISFADPRRMDKPQEYCHSRLRGDEQLGPGPRQVAEVNADPGLKTSGSGTELVGTSVLRTDATTNRKGKDYGLFIATNEYANWKSLGNAVRDAEDVAKELHDYYGFQTEIVRNPTLPKLVEVLERYSKQQYTEDDQLFIFFAGHGTYNKFTRQGYLVLSDSDAADKDKMGKSNLSYTDLRNIVDNFQCRHIFLVIDACYSGTFDEALAKVGSYRGEDDIVPPQFIERIMQFRTRRYLTSAGNAPVYDGDKGGNSPFTKKLLEALRRYGGGEGYLTIATILPKVQVVTPTPIPGEWGQNEPGSDFFFIIKKR